MPETSNSTSNPSAKTTLGTLWPGLRYLSLGILLAWIYLLLDFGAWRSNSDAGGMALSMGNSWFFGTALAVLAAAIVRHESIERLFDGHCAPWTIAIMNVLGISGLVLAGPHILPDTVPLVVHDICFPLGYVLCGIVSTFIMIQCARLYCQLQPDKVFLYALLSELVTFVVFAIVVTYGGIHIAGIGPSLSGTLALYVLPLIALACLSLPGDGAPIKKEDGQGERNGQTSQRDQDGRAGLRTGRANRPSGAAKTTRRDPDGDGDEHPRRLCVLPLRAECRGAFSLWRVYLAAFVFTLTAAIIRNCFAGSQPTAAFQADAQLTILIRTAIALALIACSLTVMKRIPLEKFYLFAATGIALVLVSIPLFGVENAFFRAMANSLFYVLDLMIWCLLAFTVHARHYPAVMVFGLGRGCVCLGMLAGYLLGASSDVSLLLTTNKITTVVLAVTVLVCANIVFNERIFSKLLSDIDVKELSFRRIIPRTGLSMQPITYKSGQWAQACENVGNRANLSKREQEILRQLADNRTPHDTASYLCISLSTVRTHTRNIYAKLDVHSRDELIVLVRDEYGKISGGTAAKRQ